jgi:hypothetical protein
MQAGADYGVSPVGWRLPRAVVRQAVSHLPVAFYDYPIENWSATRYC